MLQRRLTLGFLVSVFAVLALIASSALAAPQPIMHREFVVVIDPGHGGTNEGCAAHDGSTREKEVTVAVAHKLRAHLARLLPHAEVVLTRENDVTMTLAERVELANAVGADLFISIHANASPEKNQVGYETYVLDVTASNLEAARTAQRENDEGFVSLRPPDSVSSMVRELGLVENRARAVAFAREIQKQTMLAFPGRADRGVRQAPFDVLMGARMPAVLHEIGFLDHDGEGPMMLSESGQAEVALALAKSVVGYYRDVERKN